jgi:hypothetical protein
MTSKLQTGEATSPPKQIIKNFKTINFFTFFFFFMGHFARLGLDTADQIQHNTEIILYRTGNMPAEAFENEHVKKNLSRILPY